MAHHTGRVAETVPLTMRDSALTSALAGAYRTIPYGWPDFGRAGATVLWPLSSRAGGRLRARLPQVQDRWTNLLSTTPSPR